MKHIKLLDCTMRDGGYINDWKFGHSTIVSIYKRLDDSGVDFIEVGFLDDRRTFDMDRSIQPDTTSFNKIYAGVQKKHATPVAMIDFGTCNIDNISPAKDTFIDGIRVIFKKEKIDEALPFCKAIKDKGYKLFIQAVSITSYSDMEMLEYIQKINKIHPTAFSIVDTYGLLNNRKLAHYFDLLDNNLSPDIKIGYHGHNNFQLAFSNTMKFLQLETKRTIVADASVYGMGKSAGNCAIELLALYMNSTFGTKYDINQYLEIFETNLSHVYREHYWGYKYNFYIAAMQQCHPNYVNYLLDKKTLTVTDINLILAKVPQSKKLSYDAKYIEQLYMQYQSNAIDDGIALKELKSQICDASILLLGSGSSIVTESKKVKKFIAMNNSVVIAVNCDPSEYNCDYIFLSNAKRYISLMDTDLKEKLIITSNVSDYDHKAKYVLNFASSLGKTNIKSDNALLLLLNNLIRLGIKEVALAGFDGYKSNEQNYYSESLEFAGNDDYKIKNNKVMAQALKQLNNQIKIEFITPSLYEASDTNGSQGGAIL